MVEGTDTRREAISLTPEGGSNVRFQAKPDVVFGNLQRELQRSLDLTALAFQATTEQPEVIPEIPSFPRVQLGSRLSAGDLQEYFRSWIIGHAITDLVEAMEPLLSDVARISRVAVLHEQGAIDGDALRVAIEAADLEVPLGQKLATIAREFPALVTKDLEGALKSLNKLRVCLTHSGGWVREKDCNVPGGLELSQVFWEFWVQYESGREERVTAGLVTKEPGTLLMKRSRTPRCFKVGEKVEVDLGDLAVIASTVFELSLILRKELYSFLRDTGLFPENVREPERRLTFTAEFGIAKEVSSLSPQLDVVEGNQELAD